MSFQLSILKILDGQTDGRAGLEVIKQHLAILERPAAADHGVAPVEPSLADPVTEASVRPAP